MALAELNWQPTPKQLRQFGWTGFVALPLLAWWWGAQGTALFAALLLGTCLGVLGWWRPRALRVPFLALSLLTWPIGAVVGEVVLLVIYFGIITPLGLWFWLRGRDVLHMRPDPTAKSYWQDRPPQRPFKDYYRQF